MKLPKPLQKTSLLRRAGLVGALVLLPAGCGPAGSATARSESPSTWLEGQVVDGPLVQAEVSVYVLHADGTRGPRVAGPVRTDAEGRYRVALPEAAGPLLVESAGGAFVDWATGRPVQLDADDVLSVILPEAASDTARAHVTPLTHMAAARALRDARATGDVAQSARAAQAQVEAHFQVPDIVATDIVDATREGAAAGASQASVDYALVLGGIAKAAEQAGVSNPFDFVQAAAQDASDGALDGTRDGEALLLPTQASPVALAATALSGDLRAAILAFQDSAQNASGGRASPRAVEAIGSATGRLPGAAPVAGDVGGGAPGAGAPGAGTPDAAAPDAGASDAGAPDAGAPHAGAPGGGGASPRP